MLYPKNIAQKLSFDLVLAKAATFCDTRKGQEHFNRIKVSGNKDIVELWLNQTSEVKSILEQGELSFGLNLDFDLQDKAARAIGFFYEIEDILQIKDLLISLNRILSYLASKDDLPFMSDLFHGVAPDFALIGIINTGK